MNVKRKIEPAIRERREAPASAESEISSSAKAATGTEALDQRTRVAGKLPPRPKEAAVDSSAAAARCLKRFFEGRR
jgi:hypothetical protein